MKSTNALSIITYIFQIILFIIALLLSLIIIGHFIAHFSIGKIKLFKYVILISSCLISIISFLLIYTDVLPIVVLVTVLASFRWIKYELQNYPFINSVKSQVDFGTSLFLTVCSILLWFIFEIFDFHKLSLIKFAEFFISSIFIPLMVIFTICFNDKKMKKDENNEMDVNDSNSPKNESLKNYYIEFSNRIVNKLIKSMKKPKND